MYVCMYVDTRPTYLWISAFWCWWTRRGLSSQQVWPEALTLLLVTCPHSIYVHTPLLYYPPSAAHCSNCSICPNGKMDLSELQNLFVHMGSIYGAVHSTIYPMLHIAHCSCCYLVCLWLTALLARGGQNARGQAGQAHLPPYGELTLGQLFFSLFNN